jgi:hypothetical protein
MFTRIVCYHFLISLRLAQNNKLIPNTPSKALNYKSQILETTILYLWPLYLSFVDPTHGNQFLLFCSHIEAVIGLQAIAKNRKQSFKNTFHVGEQQLPSGLVAFVYTSFVLILLHPDISRAGPSKRFNSKEDIFDFSDATTTAFEIKDHLRSISLNHVRFRAILFSRVLEDISFIKSPQNRKKRHDDEL